MPEMVSANGAAAQQERQGVIVPGLFEAWHRSAAAMECLGVVEDCFDPRFTEDDDPTARREAYEAAMAEARGEAEILAAQRILAGQPIPQTLLRPRSRVTVPWDPTGGVIVPTFMKSDCLYSISADDTVRVNVAATRAYREQRSAEARRRVAAAPPADTD